MSLTFTLTASNSLGAMERILGVIRYRGYQIRNLTAQATHDNRLDIELCVEGASDSPHLLRHLANLIDVTGSVMESEQTRLAAHAI